MEKNADNQDLVFRALDLSYIDAILEIQEEAFALIDNPEILRRNTRETLLPCFDAPSVVLGAFYQGVLAAFGILLYAGESKENLAYDLGMGVFDGANVKLIIVRPIFRGNGLQLRLLKELEIRAKECGSKFLLATVSPINSYSMINFQKSGYKVVSEKVKYGGVKRAILLKNIK